MRYKIHSFTDTTAESTSLDSSLCLSPRIDLGPLKALLTAAFPKNKQVTRNYMFIEVLKITPEQAAQFTTSNPHITYVTY